MLHGNHSEVTEPVAGGPIWDFARFGAQGPDEVAWIHATQRRRAALGGRGNHTPREALQGLLDGRWNLVEILNTERERILIARRGPACSETRNGPSMHERVLTARAKGLPLKAISDDLGVSIATTSRYLRSAMAAIGVECEAELPFLFPHAER